MGLAILISLGTWQFNRYQEKLESEARRDARAEEAPLELQTLAGSMLEELDYRTLTLTGTLDTSHTVLFKHLEGAWACDTGPGADGPIDVCEEISGDQA